jgi:hypothetical protein
MHMQLLIIDTNKKKKKMFKVQYLKRVMRSHGIQSQSNELTPSGAFSNIVNSLRMNTKIYVMTIEINSNKTLVIDNHKCSHPTH